MISKPETKKEKILFLHGSYYVQKTANFYNSFLHKYRIKSQVKILGTLPNWNFGFFSTLGHQKDSFSNKQKQISLRKRAKYNIHILKIAYTNY